MKDRSYASYRSVLFSWILTSVLIVLNWVYGTRDLSTRILVALVLISICLFATRSRVKRFETGKSKSGGENIGTYEHENTRIMRKRYGKFTFLRTYGSLALLSVVVALNEIMPDVAALEKLKYLVLVIFFVDGLYLCAVISRDKRCT